MKKLRGNDIKENVFHISCIHTCIFFLFSRNLMEAMFKEKLDEIYVGKTRAKP